jgi:hypothetical protein
MKMPAANSARDKKKSRIAGWNGGHSDRLALFLLETTQNMFDVARPLVLT